MVPAVLCTKAWKSWKEFTCEHDYAVRGFLGDKQTPRLLMFFHGLFMHFTCASPKLQCIKSPWGRDHTWGLLPPRGIPEKRGTGHMFPFILWLAVAQTLLNSQLSIRWGGGLGYFPGMQRMWVWKFLGEGGKWTWLSQILTEPAVTRLEYEQQGWQWPLPRGVIHSGSTEPAQRILKELHLFRNELKFSGA